MEIQHRHLSVDCGFTDDGELFLDSISADGTPEEIREEWGAEFDPETLEFDDDTLDRIEEELHSRPEFDELFEKAVNEMRARQRDAYADSARDDD